MNQKNEKNVVQEVALVGDLSKLTEEERWDYYKKVCEFYDLNPLTRPFSFIQFEDSGKLQLYALRSATDQLRKIHDISVSIIRQENLNGLVYMMTARAKDKNGRIDEAIGSVPLCDDYGNSLTSRQVSNAIMACQTKAIRRATLSICGVTLMDESEILDIPNAITKPAEPLWDNPLVNNAPTENPVQNLENLSEPPLLNSDINQSEKTETSSVTKNSNEWVTGIGLITGIQRLEGNDGKPYHMIRIEEETSPDGQGSYFDAYAISQLSQAIEEKFIFECAEVNFKAEITRKGILLHSLTLVEQPQMNI